MFDLPTLTEIIAHALTPARFYVRPDFTLVWQPPELEEIRWELFRGRLLDPAHTRQMRRFLAWNIFSVTPDSESANAAPLVSVKFDQEVGQIHVVRGFMSHVW